MGVLVRVEDIYNNSKKSTQLYGEVLVRYSRAGEDGAQSPASPLTTDRGHTTMSSNYTNTDSDPHASHPTTSFDTPLEALEVNSRVWNILGQRFAQLAATGDPAAAHEFTIDTLPFSDIDDAKVEECLNMMEVMGWLECLDRDQGTYRPGEHAELLALKVNTP